MTNNRFIRGFLFLLCAAGFILVLGATVMLLWNWLIPAIFNGPQISFVQGLGLLLLGKILFGGFRSWGCGKHCCGGKYQHGKHGFWRKKFEEKYGNLSEEEKAKLKERFKSCCNTDEDNIKEH